MAAVRRGAGGDKLVKLKGVSLTHREPRIASVQELFLPLVSGTHPTLPVYEKSIEYR